MKKLSIIIPVFNVENYVAKCIKSCLNQDLCSSDYEIIIINDGSRDNSLKIVNEVAKNEKNIIVVSQENSGLSLARNNGLKIAQGEYIWFIDSDDWIETNCLGSIIEELIDVDVLAMGYIDALDNSLINRRLDVYKSKIVSGIDLLQNDFIIPAQFYIYSRQFLKDKNLFFLPGVYHEDFEFTPRMLFFAKKIKLFTQLVYFFYKRQGSITTSVIPRRSFDLIKIALNLILFEQKCVNKKYKHIFHNMVWLALNNALFNSLIMDKKARYLLAMELYNQRWVFKYLNYTTILKYKIERILFDAFPRNCLFIYRLIINFKYLGSKNI